MGSFLQTSHPQSLPEAAVPVSAVLVLRHISNLLEGRRKPKHQLGWPSAHHLSPVLLYSFPS